MGNVTDLANDLIDSTGDWVQKYADANDAVIRQNGKTYISTDLVRAVQSKNDYALAQGVMSMLAGDKGSTLVAAVTSTTLINRSVVAQVEKGDIGLAEVKRRSKDAMGIIDG